MDLGRTRGSKLVGSGNAVVAAAVGARERKEADAEAARVEMVLDASCAGGMVDLRTLGARDDVLRQNDCQCALRALSCDR
jgi:hypothetical protein